MDQYDRRSNIFLVILMALLYGGLGFLLGQWWG